MTDSEKLDLILSKIDSMNSRLGNLENEVNNLKNKFDDLEYQIKLKSLTVEDSINKAIQALGEGHQLNAERFDKLDIEAVKNKADIALSLSQLTNERMDRLIDNLNKTA